MSDWADEKAAEIAERDIPVTVWSGDRHAISNTIAAALKEAEERGFDRGTTMARSVEAAFTNIALKMGVYMRIVDGEVLGLHAPTGHILDDQGRVLPLAPKADGTPSELFITADNHVVGKDSAFWFPPRPGEARLPRMRVNDADFGHRIYAIRANAEAAKGKE